MKNGPEFFQCLFASKGYSTRKQHIHVHFNKKRHTIIFPIEKESRTETVGLRDDEVKGEM